MGASSLILNPKRHKLDGEDEMEGNSKSLSNLPDVIIQNILSRLPTKDAIRTSILSKRWEYLWTSIPKLHFYLGIADARSPLVNIVERALLLRGPADIEVFHLALPVKGDAYRVNAWISAIVKRNVERVYMSLYSQEGPFSLPHSFFTSATMTACELDFPLLSKIPSTVYLPSLKILSLGSVVFSNDSIQHLFSGCPVLEELSLKNCSWSNVKFVSIQAPKLLKLTIDEDSLLCRYSDGCQIMIFGVSLTYFSYSGDLLNEYCFYNSASPNEALIHLSYSSGKKRRNIAYRFYKLLRGLSNVEGLTISYDAFEVVLNSAPELRSLMPVFNDLTTLLLEDPIDIGQKALLTMLQYCPCLECLVFLEGIRLSSDCVEDDGVLEPLPPCFSSHLKTIEVWEFTGDQDEFSALKILVKNAVVLEKVDLACPMDFNGGPEKKTEIAKLLLDLPIGSGIWEVKCFL